MYEGIVCGHCKMPFRDIDNVCTCPECGVYYHLDCWEKHRGCCTTNCKNNPANYERSYTTESVTSESRTQGQIALSTKDEKNDFKIIQQQERCPNCGTPKRIGDVSCAACGYLYVNGTEKNGYSQENVTDVIIGQPVVQKKKFPVAKVFGIVAVSVLVLLVGGYFFVHDYSPATCTEPQICKICGKKHGEPLGHSYVLATCTDPETCTVCGATSGSPLGHSTDFGTCIVCKEQQHEELVSPLLTYSSDALDDIKQVNYYLQKAADTKYSYSAFKYYGESMYEYYGDLKDDIYQIYLLCDGVEDLSPLKSLAWSTYCDFASDSVINNKNLADVEQLDLINCVTESTKVVQKAQELMGNFDYLKSGSST